MGLKSESIAISGGQFRGRKIPLPPAVSGHRHFTPSLLKEAVFQLLNNRGSSGPFWDLCTGSGQMGLEALSRGFQPVHMVELDRSRFSWLRKVCREYPVTLHNKDFLRTPPMILEARSPNTVCFLDLPYSFWSRDQCPKLDAFLHGLQKAHTDEPLPFIVVQAPHRYSISSEELEYWVNASYQWEFREYRGRYLILLDPR